MPLLQQVAEQIKCNDLLTTGETVVVAVSGGPDSVALLHVLSRLQERLDLQLVVAHLNHCLRGAESLADAQFVRDLARMWQLEVHVATRDVQAYARQRGVSAQVAAREVRYNFLAEIAVQTGASKVALGHHADDQAETILLHLIRGAGAGGLVGMLPVREDFFIRPLLGVRRSAIVRYCQEHNLATRQDSSNTSPKYLRNRLRLELAPILENYNPNWVESVNRLGEILREEDDYLEQQAHLLYQRCKLASRAGTILLDRRILQTSHRAMTQRLIRKSWSEITGDRSDLEYKHIDRILAIIKSGGRQRQIHLPRGIICICSHQHLMLTLDGKKPEVPFYQYHLLVPGITAIPETGVVLRAEVVPAPENKDTFQRAPGEAWFDYDCLEWPLVVRQRLAGDRFRPLGLGGLVKLKKYFIDRKLPLWLRDQIPIVLSGKDIIWVAGLRPGERCKITRDTKKCLKLYLVNQDKLIRN